MRLATTRSLSDVTETLEEIHDLSGRIRNSDRFSSRTLDLDVLLYGELCADGPPLQLPRDDLIEYAFVLAPMADLEPDLLHPLEKKSMRALWLEFSDPGQGIRRLECDIS